MKDSDAKLEEKLDWKEKVFDSLSLPGLILSPDRNIVSVNRKFEKAFGIRKAEVIGKR